MIIDPYFPMENLLNISIHFHVCSQLAYIIFMSFCLFIFKKAVGGGITDFSYLVEKGWVAAGGTQC